MNAAEEIEGAVGALCRRLREAGIVAHVVGGAARDALLGRPIRDYDVVVACDLDRAAAVLPEAHRIRAQRPLLSIPRAGAQPAVEISARREGELEDDLRRRDFTLNAIAFEPCDGRWLDPHGGIGDLAARRLVAADPARGLRDDPIRILRGVRLAVELGLEIESETEHAMGRDAPRLAHAPGERIRDELWRILTLEGVISAIESLRRLGALAAVLPELVRTIGVAQNRHHPDDVYRHTLRVCEGARAGPLLRLAALLHDIAKPDTKVYAPKRADFTFWRHDVEGARALEPVIGRLRLSRADGDVLVRLVRHHLLFPERLETDAAVRRMIRRAGSDILDDLLELRRADLASRLSGGELSGGELSGGEDGGKAGALALAEWARTCDRIRRTPCAREAPRLAIGGRDVMRELGIGDGPEVGRWLAAARRRVLEDPSRNDRDRLLAWLRDARVQEQRRGDAGQEQRRGDAVQED